MNILLINPPNLEYDSLLATQPYSLGLLTLYNTVKESGYSIDIINCNNFDQLNNIDFSLYTLVGLPCYTRQRYSVFKTVNHIKNISPNTSIFLGGPHVLGIEKEILMHYPSCDYIIAKEGEVSLIKLITALQQGKEDLSDIPNLSWRLNNKIVKNGYDYIMDLDDIPYPYYHNKYFQDYSIHSRGGMYFKENGLVCAVSLSRGCNNSCVFCANKACFGPQRFFSLDYSKTLLDFLYYNHNIKILHFVDDDFCSNHKRVVELCDYMIENQLKFQWRCSTRANNISIPLVKKMIDAGCKMISVGIESGSQKVLDSIQKNYNLKNIIKELCEIRKLDIEIRFSLTFGYEKEDFESYKETIDMINMIKPHAAAFFFLKVYPGTFLYEQAKCNGYISDDFWFEDEHSVPYFEMYKSYNDFCKVVKPYILNGINAKTIKSYNEGRDDSEYYFQWEE